MPKADTLDRYRDKRDFRQTSEPSAASCQGCPAQTAGPDLRRPEARRPSPPLGLPPGARGCALELGGAEGPVHGHARQAPRRPRRGPPARLRRVRGRDPGRQLRRRHRRAVGSRNLGATRRPSRRPPGRRDEVHPRRRPAARRLRADPPQGQAVRTRGELAAHQGARRRGTPWRRRGGTGGRPASSAPEAGEARPHGHHPHARPGRPPRPAPRSAQAAARHPGRHATRRRRLVQRGQVRRLPHPGRTERPGRAPPHPQRAGLDGTPAHAGPGRRRTAGGKGVAGWRARGPRTGRPLFLPRAAGRPRRRHRPQAGVLLVRPAASRRMGPAPLPSGRSQDRPAGPQQGLDGRAALQRPPHRRSRAGPARSLLDGAGRHHLQARGCPLHCHPIAQLAEGEMPGPGGVRRPGLDPAPRCPQRPRQPPRRLPRPQRNPALRRWRRHRLHRP